MKLLKETNENVSVYTVCRSHSAAILQDLIALPVILQWLAACKRRTSYFPYLHFNTITLISSDLLNTWKYLLSEESEYSYIHQISNATQPIKNSCVSMSGVVFSWRSAQTAHGAVKNISLFYKHKDMKPLLLIMRWGVACSEEPGQKVGRDCVWFLRFAGFLGKQWNPVDDHLCYATTLPRRPNFPSPEWLRGSQTANSPL
jgi:hypothetical protein